MNNKLSKELLKETLNFINNKSKCLSEICIAVYIDKDRVSDDIRNKFE